MKRIAFILILTLFSNISYAMNYEQLGDCKTELDDFYKHIKKTLLKKVPPGNLTSVYVMPTQYYCSKLMALLNTNTGATFGYAEVRFGKYINKKSCYVMSEAYMDLKSYVNNKNIGNYKDIECPESFKTNDFDENIWASEDIKNID